MKTNPFNTKYTFTGESKIVGQTPVYRIKALKDLLETEIYRDNLGGWISSEDCLNIEDDSWVDDNSIVISSLVSKDSLIKGNSLIQDSTLLNSIVLDSTITYSSLLNCGLANTRIDTSVIESCSLEKCTIEDTRIVGPFSIRESYIKSISDYIVFKENWGDGDYFVYTFRNNKWHTKYESYSTREFIGKMLSKSEEAYYGALRAHNTVKSIIKKEKLILEL